MKSIVQVSEVAAEETTLQEAISLYLAAYTGRDTTREQRLAVWVRIMGEKPLNTITVDDVDNGMALLGSEAPRVYSGLDADGNAIFKRKGTKRSGSTLNRYLTALAARQPTINPTRIHQITKIKFRHVPIEDSNRLLHIVTSSWIVE